jgi:5-bromo-4-chloroindolyl phosphate hydrolysis protein
VASVCICSIKFVLCVYTGLLTVLSVSIKSYISIVCRVLGEMAVYTMQETMASGVVMKRTLM